MGCEPTLATLESAKRAIKEGNCPGCGLSSSDANGDGSEKLLCSCILVNCARCGLLWQEDPECPVHTTKDREALPNGEVGFPVTDGEPDRCHGQRRADHPETLRSPWLLYSDGACRDNPGPAAIGVVIIDATGREVCRVSRKLGRTTNNEAEYRAAIAALEEALALGARRVELRLDSELVVRQVEGSYRVLNPKLRPLYKRVLALQGQFEEVVLRRILREENRLADALANAALDQGGRK